MLIASMVSKSYKRYVPFQKVAAVAFFPLHNSCKVTNLHTSIHTRTPEIKTYS